ncbi:MAG: cell surface protein SprA [Fimbriimonadaceae bacterium]|nr:cell surface protein SprA [Chitinophagales bacterium]
MAAGVKFIPQVVFVGAVGLAVMVSSGDRSGSNIIRSNISPSYYLQNPDNSNTNFFAAVGDSCDTCLHYPLSDEHASDYFNPSENPFDIFPSVVDDTLIYDPETGEYMYMEKIGDEYYKNPQYISFEDYLDAELEKSLEDYWVERSSGADLLGGQGTIPSLYTGSELLDRLFGGSTVDIRPQGNIELTFGGSFQNIQNPILTEDQRKQGGFDFNMDINANVLGQIGEKMKLTFNYNTSATFDFENQVKLEYTGFPDEIIQKIEAGNVSLPLTTTLIPGTQSLFGIKTALQFNRLTVTTILSQQKSQTQSIQIEGGAQKREFEIFADEYDENRHFFLGHYFRNNYEQWLSTLPFVNSPIAITRLEVWVTNTTGETENTRDIVAFADLGEGDSVYQSVANGGSISILTPGGLPSNYANTLYPDLSANESVRQLNTVIQTLQAPPFELAQQQDFEKVRMRKLETNDYSYNAQLGFISVNTSLQPDDVLAVAYEYTYLGQNFQVGEFSGDLPPGVDTTNVLFMKMLKSTSANTEIPLWDLMMKNVYSLGAFQVSNEDFQLDVLYQDPGGGLKRYIPANNDNVNGTPLIRLMNLDRLNNNNDPYPDGIFDFVNGITINTTNGRVYFPVLEPFGDHLRDPKVFGSDIEVEKYAYDELYDETKTVALQFPQFDRYVIKGSYKSSVSSEIYLGAFNLPKGSVIVNAGGQVLQENVDYTIDYSLGRLKIINESILNSGVPINVTFENNAFYGFQVKSLVGSRFDYWINDNFTLGATVLHLSERPYTQKVNYGDDPISNTMLGFDINYTKEAPWLTRALDKLPLFDTKEMSTISFSGEVAKFIPGVSKAIGKGDEATIYIDDFEGSRSAYDLKFPFSAWVLASTPQGATSETGTVLFPEANLFDSLEYGMNRSKIAWYTIDPLFLRPDNAARPDHLTANDVSNHYLIEIQEQEIFPQVENAIAGFTTISTFDLAYYPSQRGPHNYDALNVNPDGSLLFPEERFGGIMRSLETNDFEAANIEFLEFWVMDPFDDRGPFDSQVTDDGYLYINLGNISEDILKDSRTFFENGLPKDGTLDDVDETNWGYVPRTLPITNAFDNDPASRENQDKGYDGLNNTQENSFFATYLSDLAAILGAGSEAYINAKGDPSSDDYHYYRGTDYDNQETDLFSRYNKYNNAQGNSPTTESSPEIYPTSATNLPETEDLNKDYSLNETESYFQYRLKLEPGMEATNPFITDVVVAPHTFENDETDDVKWYQFKIPVNEFDAKVGSIQDFKSIRFIRMFMTGFDESVVMRFARLELVRNQWRRYEFSLVNPGEYIPGDDEDETDFNVSSVSFEENSERVPIAYVLPPGVEREQTIGSGGTTSTYQQNEQSLSMQVCALTDGDSRAIFKTLNIDLRKYGRLIMNVHGEELPGTSTGLTDGKLNIFIRLGSDFTNNYYEYTIPLDITEIATLPSLVDEAAYREAVWATLIDIPLDSLVEVKKIRNAEGVSPLTLFTIAGSADIGATYSIVGNPDLGFVEEVMIGISNPKDIGGGGDAYCAEVWVNELRLSDIDQRGGWAALARIDAKLADLGNITLSGNMHSIGFGTLEQQIDERYQDNFYQYAAALTLELGKFFPASLGIRLPLYASISQSFSNPEFDPYDLDVDLKEKVADITETYGADSAAQYQRSVIDFFTVKSINFTNIRIERDRKGSTPRPWNIENFDLTLAYSEEYNSNPTLEYDKLQRYKGALGYTFSQKAKYILPFEDLIDKKYKWLALIRDVNFNIAPTSYSFRTELNRQFAETLMRDIYGDGLIEPTYDKYFNWDRFYGIKFEPFKAMKIDFSATNNSRIDEPFGKIDTQEEKDTIWNNIQDFGRTINYRHSFSVNYNVPINKIPIFSWVTLKTSYNSTYGWISGSLGLLDTLGNTINNTQSKTVNGELNFRNLYNKSKFLKDYNTNNFKTKSGVKDVSKKGEEDTGDEEAEEDVSDKKDKPAQTGAAGFFIRLLISLKRITINYSENYGTTLPGFMPKIQVIGLNTNTLAPGWDFITGAQPSQQWLENAADSGWLSTATSLNALFLQNYSQNIDIRANIEPLPDFKIDITVNKTYSENHSEYFKNTNTIDIPEFEHLNGVDGGSLTMSYSILGTVFDKLNTTEVTATFKQFESNTEILSQRFQDENDVYSEGVFFNPLDSSLNPNYAEGYGPYMQDVLIPSFIAAYTGKSAENVEIDVFKQIPKPNYRITYTGLNKIPALKKIFTSITLNSAYTSTLSVNSYVTDLDFDGNYFIYAHVTDTLSGNFVSLYEIPNVIISESLSPLFGIDATFTNSLTTKFDFKKSRTLTMSFIDYQLTEIRSTEFTVGLGYKFSGFTLPIKFGGKKPTLENDLTCRFDMSFRDDQTSNFRLYQDLNEPTGGLTTISISPTIDYVVNERFNVQLYFDRQQTIPKISTSYPITSTNAGVKVRFSLAE